MFLVKKSELELVKALSKDDLAGSRYTLAAVAIGPKYSEITNGHFLIREYADRLPIEDYPAGAPEALEPANGGAPILVRADAAREAAKQIPRKPSIPILTSALVGQQNGSVVVQSTDLESWNVKKANAIEGEWPKTDGVFPQGEPAATAGFNPEYFERLAKVFRERGVKAVKLEVYGDGKPAKFSGAMADGGRLEAILMPMRLS